MPQKFTDPFEALPTFERTIIRLRACELTLTLYYKDVIERQILDQIEMHDRWKSQSQEGFEHRAPEGSKDRLRKSLGAMVSDGAISEIERADIRAAIDFRNDVGHRIDHLFSDLEQSRFTGDWWTKEIREIAGIKEFDHGAVERMRRVIELLGRTGQTHYRLGTFRLRGPLMFSSTEKAILRDIKRLRFRLKKLAIERRDQVVLLQQEMKTGFDLLQRLREKHHFDLRFDLGKMTARGGEFCYLLFDIGLSDLSIAHIFQMKLKSIQSRRQTWKKLGGKTRQAPDWDKLPIVVTPSKSDD